MEQTITVSQLARYIKQIFEAEELLFNISVVGEVSGFKLVRGIAYFDLKDESSLISCVCFNGFDYENTKNGDKIVARGTPNFYVKGGKLNFNVNKITPYGVGEIYQNFLMLKDKLLKDGLFDESHKLPLPNNVKKIGVITSETGAVIRDIITVGTRRNPAINIALYPAKVQGEGSVETIISGLNYFENKEDIDVVIIARGGGSMEDLNEFNSELLARRIYAYTKPVVSAVGHETDFTICDFVSDKRAATPSAAAELVVANITDKMAIFNQQITSLRHLISQYFDGIAQNFEYQRNELLNLAESVCNEFDYYLSLKKNELEKFNPNKILSLGYAKVENKNGVVTSKSSLQSGDEITITFKDGKVKGVTQ